MRAVQTIIACCVAATGLSLAGGAFNASRAGDNHPTTVQFSFDRPLNAGAAPIIVAMSDGLFAAQGLSVLTNVVAGSPEAIAKVASGASEFALVDINALVRFRDRGAPPVKAVFVQFNKAPYSIVARKSRGIHTLSDLEGKTLGVAESDLSVNLWPAVARLNGVNLDHVKRSRISNAVREPMLSAGQVDAVTGFSYQSAVNLRDRGVPADDLVVLRFADFGSETYGFALIVNPDFAAKKPDAVKGFVRALIAGTNIAINKPAHAIDDVLSHMDDGSRDLELERLQTVLRDNILTDEVKRNGLGGIDPARLERSIGEVAVDFKFAKRPTAADIFDDSFLPPRTDRLVN